MVTNNNPQQLPSTIRLNMTYDEYAKNIGRVDFTPTEFDKAILQHGTKVIWEKAMFCSCLDPITGQPNFADCPACGGKGYIYFEPTEIKVLAYNNSGRWNQISPGLLDVGTSLMTARSVYRIGFRDRIRFMDYQSSYSQILVQDTTKYPNGIPLKHPATEVMKIKILDQDVDPANYVVSSDGLTVKFNDGILQDQEQASILYQIHPVYIVIDIPHELRGVWIKFKESKETWYELPKQFSLKREDFMPDTALDNGVR